MVEVRIQISYLCRPLSSRYRETTYHLKLVDGAKDDYPSMQPQVTFSQDRKFLALLLFHPHQHSSLVVVFQLRRPRSDLVEKNNITNIPTPPAYVTNPSSFQDVIGRNHNTTSSGENNNNSNAVHQVAAAPVVATNPKFVSVWGITAICRVPVSATSTATTSSSNASPMQGHFGTHQHLSTTPNNSNNNNRIRRPLLLAVCHDGALVWLDLRSAQAIATGMLPISKQQLPISTMQASPTSSLEKGTVALVVAASNNDDKHHPECIIASWSLEAPRQRALVKRASTGNVMTVDNQQQVSSRQQRQGSQQSIANNSNPKSVPASPANTQASPSRTTRKTPQRTLSDTLQSMLSPGAGKPTAQRRPLRRGTRDGGDAKKSSRRSSSRDKSAKQRSRSKDGVSRTKSDTSTGSLRGMRRFESFRTRAMEMNTTELAEKLNQMNLPSLGNLVGNDNNNQRRDEEKEKVALQRRKLFVLQELQRRNPAGSWMTKEHEQLLEFGVDGSEDEEEETLPINDKVRKAPSRSSSSASLVSILSNTGIAAALHQAVENETSNDGDNTLPTPAQQSQRRYPRRRSDPDKNGADKAKRQMKVGVLSTWSGTTGNSQGEHHHINSKKVVVDVCFGALSTVLCVVYKYPSTAQERRLRLAQVLTISETGTVAPVASLLLPLDQVEQAPCIGQQSASVEKLSGSNQSLHTSSTQSLFGIEFNHNSDTFVVSAIFGNSGYWLGCVWDWRVDAIGWVIQHKSLENLLWSRLMLGRDSSKGSHLAHTSSFINDSEPLGKVEMSKHLVQSGFLSPSSATNPALFEPCSLMLTPGYVAYPRATKKVSNENLLELGWKTSSLPSQYISSYGPPTMAAIGPTNAKSIAVASSFGLCVMDTGQRLKWKQFPLIDEKEFTVVAMTWWEGRHAKKKKEEGADDLLIAITRTNSGHQYLSCWSSKRLDLAHQLMDTPREEWNVGEAQEEGYCWGIPLPNDIMATNLSLLAEPASHAKGESGLRKAVLIVYSPDQQTSEFDYSIFRLQVAKRKTPKAKSASQRNVKNPPQFVMCHKVLQGRLKNGARSVGPVSSIFIAGAWFRFDLRDLRKKSSKKLTDPEGFVVTLGVFRTPGGMESLCLAHEGAAWIHSVVKFEVAKCWLSDLVHSNTLLGSDGPPTTTFLWALELSNGEFLCWSVPSIMGLGSDQLDEWQITCAIKEERIERPKGLRLPSLVCKRDTRDDTKRWLLGALCDLGKVSEWIQQPSLGTQTAVSLGHVPESKFGCVLRSGQDARTFTRQAQGSFELGLIRTHHQSPFLMTPPAFVSSVYTLLLEAASLRQQLSTMESSDSDSTSAGSRLDTDANRLQIIERHIEHRLSTAPNKDAVMMALRLLIFRSVEMLTKIDKKHSIEQTDVSESNLNLCVELYAATVAAVRCCSSNLQFASLFLEVGRQIEPSCLSHLFPLPLPPESEESSTEGSESNIENQPLGKATARTVVDLFNLCIEERALTASASALPLLTSKAQARHYCGLLLDEAIDSFVRNTHSRNMRYDSTEEERKVIGDIFRFGIKLEDAELFENSAVSRAINGKGMNGAEDASLGSLAHTNDSNTTNDDSIQLHNSPKGRQHLLCGLNGSSSVLNYIVPSTILGETEKQKEEDAIRREASSFIRGSLDDPVLGFESLPDWDSSLTSAHVADTDINSVGGLIGDTLLDLLQSSRTNNNWKAMGALAKMLLQEGVEVPSSLRAFGEIAGKADPLDVASVLPEQYNEHKEPELNVVDYLSDEIANCSKQVKEEADATLIVNIGLVILKRLERLPLLDPGDQVVMALGVVVIILVAGSCCGRSKEILEAIQEANSLFHECYGAILA